MWIAIGIIFVGWIALNFKTSRADGELVDCHPYRKIMPYIMPGRNESIVFYDDYADAEQLLKFVERAKERFPCDISHCLVAACGIGLAENPTMNHFISGRRLYHRKQRQITFSMKRKKKNKKAKLAVVKAELQDGETFEALCRRIQEEIGVQRSSKRTYVDKELDLFNIFPRPVLDLAVKALKWVDHYNLLPYEAFTKNDGFYTSIFIANLGSLGMRAAYHHLYEWGNCPLFMMVGAIEDRAVVRDGEVVVRPMLPIRWSYDERIDDGLSSSYGMAAVRRVLENPFEELGCVDPEGADVKPMSYTEAA